MVEPKDSEMEDLTNEIENEENGGWSDYDGEEEKDVKSP